MRLYVNSAGLRLLKFIRSTNISVTGLYVEVGPKFPDKVLLLLEPKKCLYYAA
jgi:hypothetical protein